MENIIQKIETLKKAKALLIGIDAKRWITGLRTNYNGKCCFLGHIDLADTGIVSVFRNTASPLADRVMAIGMEILGRNGFAGANNGDLPDFQQPIIKDRGIAALDYCIEVLTKELESSRTDVSYDDLCKTHTVNEVLDSVSADATKEAIV